MTMPVCREWAARFAKDSNSTRFNNAIALMRHVPEVAIESGVNFANVTEEMDRKPVRAKKLESPTLAQFSVFITEMREASGRFSRACADFAEGLALPAAEFQKPSAWNGGTLISKSAKCW